MGQIHLIYLSRSCFVTSLVQYIYSSIRRNAQKLSPVMDGKHSPKNSEVHLAFAEIKDIIHLCAYE